MVCFFIRKEYVPLYHVFLYIFMHFSNLREAKRYPADTIDVVLRRSLSLSLSLHIPMRTKQDVISLNIIEQYLGDGMLGQATGHAKRKEGMQEPFGPQFQLSCQDCTVQIASIERGVAWPSRHCSTNQCCTYSISLKVDGEECQQCIQLRYVRERGERTYVRRLISDFMLDSILTVDRRNKWLRRVQYQVLCLFILKS